MNFLKKKLETFRHRNSDGGELEEEEQDSRRVPVNNVVPMPSGAVAYDGHIPLGKTRSNGSNPNKRSGPSPMMTGSYHVRSNNGYAGDISRSAPNKHNAILMGNGKPLFTSNNQQSFSTWPDDEFNDAPAAYIDPSQGEDEYDSPEEPERDNGEPGMGCNINIGQTGFFGSDNSDCQASSSDDPQPPPPLHSMMMANSRQQLNNNNSNNNNRHSYGHQAAMATPPNSHSPNGKLLRTTSTVVSASPSKQSAALIAGNRSALSSGSSSANVSRHESANSRPTGSSSNFGVSMLSSSSSNSNTTADMQSASPSSSPGNNSSSHETQQQPQQQQQPQLPQRPQPKVLGSRIIEGLDPNKVFTGIQTMVKMNQQPGGAKVPPTPPKPANFSMAVSGEVRSRYMMAPPTVNTPPDSDECEPELPSRIKAMTIPIADCASSSSPSPSSETHSSGTLAVPPKKRQAPLPPPSKGASFKAQQLQQQQLGGGDVALPPPVPNFVINNNQTPSVTSSSEGGDDLPPLSSSILNTSGSNNLLNPVVKKLSLQHTASSPITPNNNAVATSATTNFAQRASNGNSSSASSSGLSSASSSTSTSSNRLTSTLSSSLSSTGSSQPPRVLIKVPSMTRGHASAAPADVTNTTSTAFTSRKQPLQQQNSTSSLSAVQVTVISTGNRDSDANTNNNGSSSTATAPYMSDDDIYTGAESLQYNLFTFEWYHGKMTRDDSERRLRECGMEGAFLVRDCNNTATQPNALFTLCLFARSACHYIQVCRRPEANDRLAVGSQKDSEKTFATLQELVSFHMNEAPLVVQPRNSHGAESQFLCSLKHPIARVDR